MDVTLFWTAFGAIGSSLGALIGAIALIVALKAYKLPMKKKLKANMNLSSMINPINSFEVYSIKVSNDGFRPISIENVSFAAEKSTLFLDMLWKNTILEPYEPQFPVRLEQGEATTVYLPTKQLNSELRRMIESSRIIPNERIVLLIRESTGSEHRIKTNYTMEQLAYND